MQVDGEAPIANNGSTVHGCWTSRKRSKQPLSGQLMGQQTRPSRGANPVAAEDPVEEPGDTYAAPSPTRGAHTGRAREAQWSERADGRGDYSGSRVPKHQPMKRPLWPAQHSTRNLLGVFQTAQPRQRRRLPKDWPHSPTRFRSSGDRHSFAHRRSKSCQPRRRSADGAHPGIQEG
jgi:hypothetical protein